MRLPWPFGRSQRSPSTAAAGDGPADGSPVERGSGRAWRELPPLAETVGPPPLVAPSRPFAAALAGGEPPPPILAPLSHGRSLEAPRGIVVGVAKPVQAAPGPNLPRPVQRSPLSSRAHPDTDSPAEEPSFADSIPAARPVASSGVAPPHEVVQPARRRPLTSPTTIERPSLTHAHASPAGSPPVGVIGTPRSGPRPAPVQPESSSQVAAQRAPREPSAPTTLPAAHPDGPRLTVGQARRLGLGAPIIGGADLGTPVGRPIQRSPLDPGALPAVPAARPLEPPDEGHLPASGGPTEMTLPPRRSPAPTAPQAEASVPPLGPPAVVRAPAITAGSTAPARPSPRPAPATSPIVSRQPLRTAVQRSPITHPTSLPEVAGPEPTRPSGAAAASTTGAVRIHRGAEAGDLAAALDAKSFTHGGEIFMPDNHGPLSSGRGRALLAHELTHVTQQRRLGSSLPPEHTPAGKVLEAEAVMAERSSSLPLAAQSGADGRRSTEAPAPGTLTAGSAASAPGPVRAGSPEPQRAPNGDRATAGSAGRATGGGASHGHSEQELEILAHQLYHRIGRHLRRELLVDRERLGFALDRQ
jgi:Domain of unknown function (DUF4157)